ncbi:TIGR02186 family protein [Pacificibacter sp. AS14]|uniref:TIGR02186 family protein n=1 Tax=Pacificibacter sp. AS14 TaxID=3135785 RepID=UPI00317F09F5
MRGFFLALALTFAPLWLSAEEVVADLSQNRVSITANFDGSEILIFGAIKREAAIPNKSELDVIVTVTGPKKIETILRKARRFGIWVNVERERLGQAPSFYSVASTRPVEDVIIPTTDALWKITADEQILSERRGLPAREALLRIRSENGLYRRANSGVTLTQDTLFNTSIALPANLVEGDYVTRILLVRDGLILDDYSTEIQVQKVGIERWLYNLAHDNALIYGLLSLALAVIAGWGASEIFRLIRR